MFIRDVICIIRQSDEWWRRSGLGTAVTRAAARWLSSTIRAPWSRTLGYCYMCIRDAAVFAYIRMCHKPANDSFPSFAIISRQPIVIIERNWFTRRSGDSFPSTLLYRIKIFFELRCHRSIVDHVIIRDRFADQISFQRNGSYVHIS